MQALQDSPRTRNSYKFYQSPSAFVAKHWPVISEFILRALPEHIDKTEELRANLLESIVKEILQVWIVVYDNPERAGDIASIFTTYPSYDFMTGIRSLVVYTVTTMDGNVDQTAYSQGMKKLSEYGKSKGCTKLVTTTTNDIMAEKARHLGGVIHHLAVWEI
jgi:hypothetical protein